MNDVLDICRYIINYSNDKDYEISNLKLQKLLYFVQAFFLSFTDSHQPCFPEEIEAWDFGPVVPEAYHEYKKFGNTSIPKIIFYTEQSGSNPVIYSKYIFNPKCICKENRKIIVDVIDSFSDYSANELVKLTHAQAPWKDAYIKDMNCIISKESIRRYFNEE